jgi:RND family efflux transporter MFP subunit
MQRIPCWHLGLLIIFSILLVGCNRGQSQAPVVKPAAVRVAHPVVKEITDYEDITGRTESKHAVDVKARVTGYLEKDYLHSDDKTDSKYPHLKIGTREGTIVEKDFVLFEIDPRTYQAEFDKANAMVFQAEAKKNRLAKDYARASKLYDQKSISQQEYDTISGDYQESQANFKLALANRDAADINLKFTKVKAPFRGLVSRRMVDPGNLVKADDTTLTSIVSLNPMYVYFDVDERTLLLIRHWMREGKVPGISQKGTEVDLGLADEEEFPHKGTIDFMDNKLDPGTGTLRLRGVFDNSEGKLYPGLFVRLRIQIGNPHPAVLVAERALGTDQGQKFVYLVDDKNKVVYKSVKLGSLHGGLRVVEDLLPYQLNDKALNSLKADKIPETVLKKLATIKGKELNEQKFRKELGQLLDKDEREKYQEQVLIAAQDFDKAKTLKVIVSGLQRVREKTEVEYGQVENMLDQRPGQKKK